jgi:Response regulator containing CheY-like receiver, AAA-type ATPase, and DNA-binding domains
LLIATLPMFQKESVLIVEDDADMMEYISETLQNNGYEVLLAKDGQEGFQLATKLVPNLVLSDLMMPVMDGLELTVKNQGG